MRAIVVDQGSRLARMIFPYGTSLCWVALAVGITMYFGSAVVGFAPLLLAAVMYSAWRSGVGPGLAAAGVATVATAYFLAEPLNSLEINWENGPRLVIFLMVALLCVMFHAPARLAAVLGRKTHANPAPAKVERTESRPVMEKTDAYDLIDQALRARVREIDEKDLQLTVHLEAERRTVEGDPMRLRYLFWLLLGNAIDAEQRGGTIVISVTDGREGHLELEVADTGEGIEAALLPYVFDAAASGERNLSACKAIVEAHRGRITAHSPGRGQGAAIVVRLPAMG